MIKHQHISIDNTDCPLQPTGITQTDILVKTNFKYIWLLRKYDLIIQVSVAMETLQENNSIQQQGLDCFV